MFNVGRRIRKERVCVHKTWALLRSLGPVDLRAIARDSMLLLVTLGSLALAWLIRSGVPLATPWLLAQYGFDLRPLYPLIMSLVVVMASSMAGTVVGFLLLDERDDGTLRALLVTPVPLSAYVAYRLGLPIVLTLLITPLAVHIAGLITIPLWQLLLVSLPASLSGATMALLLVALAENKVAGLAVTKVLQGIQALPLAAFFLTPPFQWSAGIVPSYWPLAVYWRMVAGEPFWGYWGVGMIVNGVTLGILMRRYEQNLR